MRTLILACALILTVCVVACGDDDGGSGSGGTAGSSASGSGGAGAGGTAGTGGACLAANALCDANPTNCCAGTFCLQASGIAAQCQQRCDDNSDCASNCCLEAGDNNDRICAPSSLCGGPGPQCESTVGAACGAGVANCCSELLCISSSTPEFVGCQEGCTDESDCASGCCRPTSNAAVSFCVDARYCACSGTGEECGGSTGLSCCENSICIMQVGSTTAGCAPTCTDSSECASQCCTQLSNGTDRVCIDNGGNPC